MIVADTIEDDIVWANNATTRMHAFRLSVVGRNSSAMRVGNCVKTTGKKWAHRFVHTRFVSCLFDTKAKRRILLSFQYTENPRENRKPKKLETGRRSTKRQGTKHAQRGRERERERERSRLERKRRKSFHTFEHIRKSTRGGERGKSGKRESLSIRIEVSCMRCR